MNDIETYPVHKDKDNGKWYFWDEYWLGRYGPFDSEQEARNAFIEYAKSL